MVNIKLEKKEYVAPVMPILDMGSKAAFLSCSGGDCDVDQGEYDDEFGFNHHDGMNRHV
jgi:hypothetical protein